MRKEIIKRFLIVLVIAIGLTGVLFLVTVSAQIRNTMKDDTIKEAMFYTAIRSSRSDCVLRIAIPSHGNYEYLLRLLPAFLLSITVAFIIAFISTERLVRSLTQPIQSIVNVMGSYNKNHMKLEFEETPYEELNIITEAAINMSDCIKEYAQQLDFERMTKEEFFANASHELKTPITAIRGYMELLLGDFATDKETQLEFMNRVLVETKHITTLVNDILTIAELESWEYEVTLSEVRVTLVLEDVIASYKVMAATNNITITYDCIPVKVVANEQHIKQILTNLISNAIKYNRTHGSVHVTIKSQEDTLIIEVLDTGVGIPKDAQIRVFERFYRVDKGRSRKVEGTGLGLAIVKHIVNYYHGSITVQSELNVGSTFTCILPEIIVR